ncbi:MULTISPECIES: sialidase family protein [Agrobacterium tumefaciens complex]|uniref:Exo-alpha-sialidase n=1 Tax=Agrobacterium radiobacter TaxID=362 RepID=A0ABD5LGH2_AGRRD|nr:MULTISPECIES: exo-alpha-sialidase [Agrobacterium tumefaciens complex]MCP2136869.1 putative neuraminidase [Rhizobium sp. SLBN-94]KAA1233638.1 glycosyl hydrolase [Agrobacterium tumefaciens]KAB0461672.1 glycosyl hydrolase [Agrobacterium tumefaciens]KWT77958.1 glycosyl hydrolase [Agrobacterium radiobacter]NIB10760.1 glycosyl hydrolase [Agrobacterium radiobacter]
MTPDDIAHAMTGAMHAASENRQEAFLPSPMIQNHASFLHLLDDGTLICVWFGGTLEGKSDISIFASVLTHGSTRWGPPQRLSHDPAHSEQNPVLFTAPDGVLWLFHTAQPSGNQDECRIRMARVTRDPTAPEKLVSEEGRFLDLPQGCFIRAPLRIRDDGAWLLPIFRCVQRPGQKWNGSHDTAALGISTDNGATWQLQELQKSTGCVHMSPVAVTNGHYAAFFRRRQADFVYRTESADGGRSWSKPQPTDVPNNNSSIAVIRLGDGRLAMICNPINAAQSSDRRASLYDELGEEDDRPDADPSGGCVPVWGVPRAPVSICLSNDDGRSFSTRILIEDGPGTCLSNDSTDGRNLEMSYPWLLEAPDGTLHASYTYHRRAIKYVRLAPGWADENDGRQR